MEPTFFKAARAFEQWLAAHHRTETLLLVGFYTVASGKPSIRFPQALDAALAYGWIDGLRHRVGADVYTVRFTPRKKDSFWSATNTKRALELINERRMKPAGLAAFERRDEERTRRVHAARDNPVLDAATLRALKADKKAYAYFQALPPGMKRLYTFFITSAKRDATRAKRLAIVLERCRAGKRIDPFHPFRRD
ncbi:MAG: bacteriocin-protection protein [Acidobacteria bacterium]|nr:MAG: bacteriocin-protection protein [Acidobacteriota bacterium]